MSEIDSVRVYHRESGDTWTKERLDEVLAEIDGRVNCANCWCTINRTAGYISSISYYSDAAKTKLVNTTTITRTTGLDGYPYVTGILKIFYNTDGTEDSRITEAFTRTSDIITSGAGVFSTTEPQPPC